MVLESITSPLKAQKAPLQMFFLGFLYSSIALFFSVWIFKEHSSLIMVFLTVLATVPFMYKTIRQEEENDLKIKSEHKLLKEHSKALTTLIFLFMGFVVALSLWYTILPPTFVENLFNVQIQTIHNINARITGNTITDFSLFMQLFSNNVKVLIFCIIFAFFYGAGAIFILTWNATVIAAAVGTFFRNNISIYAQQLGFLKIAGYFHIFSMSILRYMIHGIPEILAYFVGGLAGGIISVAVIRHDINNEKFRHILFDGLSLFIIAVLILVFAALTEMYITPLFF